MVFAMRCTAVVVQCRWQCQPNSLVHQLVSPQIDYDNAIYLLVVSTSLTQLRRVAKGGTERLVGRRLSFNRTLICVLQFEAKDAGDSVERY